jgi:hypothetical protein
MSKASSRLRRRRPGEMWELWRAVGRDKATKQPIDAGYVVTTRARCPRVIGIVRGTSPASLRKALMLRRRFAAEIAAAAEGKGVVRTIPKALFGMLLYPIARTGRRIGNDGEFAGAMYQRSKRGAVFTVFTHAGLRLIEKESGTSAEPNTLAPGSKKGEKAGELKAA